MHDTAQPSVAELLDHNRDLQGSRAIRLLATHNLGLYATLMERHLADGVIPETELVIRLERDLDDVGHPDGQSGLALIKSWASQGWLHRIVDERNDQNVCYLTQDARRALDFVRGMRRNDTIATGGSIHGIASRLKQVAVRVDNDPARIRKHIEAEIAALHSELDQLDSGERPAPDPTDCYDEARAIALQMERLITDIGQYGTMIEQATAALDEPIDTNSEYRDRQRQIYADYQAAWDSQGRDSHRAFLRMINDPDLDGSFQINKGFKQARQLLVEVVRLGLPVACEYLDTISPQFVADLISWAVMSGATSESPTHRELASGLSAPVGFRNASSGDTKGAVDAVREACQAHAFLSVSKQGLAGIVETGIHGAQRTGPL